MTLRSLAPLLALCLVPVAGCKSEVDKDPATSGVTADTDDTTDTDTSGTTGTTGDDVTTTATTGDDKQTTTTNDPSSAWVVGEDATMVRLDPAGDVLFYPLETEGDLLAIACKGAEVAVAVGEDGVVLRTDNGGAAWQQLDVGAAGLLRAVALSAGTAAYVVGPDIVLVSGDDGRSFAPVAGAEGEWTAVTTSAAGTRAWLTTAKGEVWQLEGEALEPVFTLSEGPLSGIAATPDGLHLVAVGAGGLMLRSDDGGALWSTVTAPTQRDLHAVRIASDAELVIAVGAAGVVLRIDDQGASAEELLAPELALRALHLSRDGHGHVVGDHGVALGTHNAGLSWEPLELGLEQALFGLDDLHGEPHL